MQFEGRDRIRLKRVMLSYWHQNQSLLGLNLREFLRHCRISADGRRAVFTPDRSTHP